MASFYKSRVLLKRIKVSIEEMPSSSAIALMVIIYAVRECGWPNPSLIAHQVTF